MRKETTASSFSMCSWVMVQFNWYLTRNQLNPWSSVKSVLEKQKALSGTSVTYWYRCSDLSYWVIMRWSANIQAAPVFSKNKFETFWITIIKLNQNSSLVCQDWRAETGTNKITLLLSMPVLNITAHVTTCFFIQYRRHWIFRSEDL